MNWLREVTVDNPMFAEMRRPWQRMSGGGPSAPLYRVVALATILAFFSLAALFARTDAGFAPVVGLEMVVLAFFVPPMMYKTIAGERDKRSWDILISAPVSPGQIVVGRFALGAMVVAGIVALGTLIAPFTWPSEFAPEYTPRGAAGFVPVSALRALVTSQLYVLGFGLALVAVAVFISARSRRGFTALASTYALFFCWLLLLPMLLSITFSGEYFMGPLIEPLMPFTVGTTLASPYRPTATDGVNPVLLNLILPMAAYLFLTVCLLYWASRTLHFPDNQIRFLSRKHRA